MSTQVFHAIWIPSFIAVLGFVGKSVYDILLSIRNKKIEILENKLQKFYWPILIRIEKDNAIWDKILSKRDNPESLQYKLAYIIEKKYVIKNHDEILEIISSNIHLAEPDIELTDSIRKYIKNVTIYKALRDCGEENTFPFELGAEWPHNLHDLIKSRTERYQKELNRKILK